MCLLMNELTVNFPNKADSAATGKWPRRYSRVFLYLSFVVADSVAIFLAFSLAAFLRGEKWLSPGGVDLGMVTMAIYLMIAFNQGAFSIDSMRQFTDGLLKSLKSLLLTALLVVLFAFFTKSGMQISRVAFGSAIIWSWMAIMTGRSVLENAYLRDLRAKLIDAILIVDGGDKSLMQKGTPVLDARISGLVPNLADPVMLDRLATLLRDYDRVVVSCDSKSRLAWAVVLKGIGVVGEIVVPERDGVGAIGLGEFGGKDTVIVSRGPLSLTNRIKKRMFDLAVSVPALILLAPLFAVVAIAIRLESPGPALFRQTRTGQANANFQILKFRSMRTDQCSRDGALSTAREDERVTRLGRFLRATSIDELPQLINVVRGDMSMVGPRPHALGSKAGADLFWEVSETYWLRHSLKPGITGLAQIRGYRGATHKRKDLEDRLQSDIEYVNGWRLWRDVAILLGTLRVLVHPNAY